MLYDKDIREGLFDFLDNIYPVNRVIQEKNMGNSRADAVLITRDSIIGIEIKSDADTYVRLAGQVKDYDLYFDFNYVVVGSTHAAHIKEHVPEYWGIITVDEVEKAPDFYMLRAPEHNPKVKMSGKLSLLWRPELANIQKLNEMYEYKRMSKAFVMDKILEKVDSERLQLQICNELLERDYTTIADRINQFRVEIGQKPRRRRRKRRKVAKKPLK